MTRWARANNVHRHKPGEATPWSRLRGGATAAAGGAGKTTTANRKKKEYQNEDVNGFQDFLRQSGGHVGGPGGGHVGGQGGGHVGGHGGHFGDAEAERKDRRREERRLKRQNDKKNKMICFHCRLPGHGLADCPAADGDAEAASGVCYRCGSTEHDVQRCRSKVDPALGEFPFAKCFLCGLQGHMTRNCPENPSGAVLCRLCGSPDHLHADCPVGAVTVGWLSNNASADHEDLGDGRDARKPPAKTPKIVVF